MVPFSDVFEEAILRVGNQDELEERLPSPKSASALRKISDDRYLSIMSRRIFRAGLKHDMVDAKWPTFEEVFYGFDPERVELMSDEDLEALLNDCRIIRHWGKIKAVRANAVEICGLAAENGSMGEYIAGWPCERIVDLWSELAKRFSQLGGMSAPYFLRMAGKDTFLLTDFVVRALKKWSGFDTNVKGKRGRQKAQDIFNDWADGSGLPLCQISMILAQSVD